MAKKKVHVGCDIPADMKTQLILLAAVRFGGSRSAVYRQAFADILAKHGFSVGEAGQSHVEPKYPSAEPEPEAG